MFWYYVLLYVCFCVLTLLAEQQEDHNLYEVLHQQ